MSEQLKKRTYSERWDRIAKHLEEKDKEIFIASQEGNVRYLSCAHIPSFPLLAHVIIDRDGHTTGIASSLEQFRAMEEAQVDDLKTFSPYPGIESEGKTGLLVLKRLIRDGEWKGALCDTRTSTRLVKQERSNLIENMRIKKSPQEIRFIETAAAITDEAASQLHELALPGKSERQVANELNGLLRQDERVQTNSFETIVAGGPKSAFSHHDVTERKLRKGDLVILDFGVYVNGYCSDCTRTIAVGEPSEELKRVFELVREGQEKGISQVAGGEMYGAIDASIRELFEESGDYHRYFVHSTGHGIGLEVHEAPNGIRFDMKKKMEDGHVFTVEPGIYIPGKGGVRIEDDILVEDGRPRLLTRADRTL